ncbi:hypothetical protein ACFOLI_13495 [Algoriphagus hitonicola]|uniref:hypothetical protein n=1 Tax=Algoriphagus hitonicola TaxID=435880 RepID=UPI0036163F01
MKISFSWVSSLILASILLLSPKLEAQIISPPEWKVSLSPEKPRIGEKTTLIFEAKIPASWYVYGTDFDPDLGPLITTLILEESDSFSLEGTLKEVDAKKKYDEVWKGDITYFTEEGVFEQEILIKNSGTITGFWNIRCVPISPVNASITKRIFRFLLLHPRAKKLQRRPVRMWTAFRRNRHRTLSQIPMKLQKLNLFLMKLKSKRISWLQGLILNRMEKVM